MRLLNETDYSTRDLRRIVVAVHNAETRGPLATWSLLRVEVKYARRSAERWLTTGRRGQASLSGKWMGLWLPRGQVPTAHLVALVRHELWHSYGLRHRDYPRSLLYCTVTAHEEAIVRRLRLGDVLVPEERLPQAASSRADRRTVELARIEAGIARWSSKLRRAQNALEKLDRRRRYYTRLVAVTADRET